MADHTHTDGFSLPECCYNCVFHDSDTADPDGYGPCEHFCIKNIMLPVKKQTCKKQRLYKKPEVKKCSSTPGPASVSRYGIENQTAICRITENTDTF
jgi:hypothetical protein